MSDKAKCKLIIIYCANLLAIERIAVKCIQIVALRNRALLPIKHTQIDYIMKIYSLSLSPPDLFSVLARNGTVGLDGLQFFCESMQMVSNQLTFT